MEALEAILSRRSTRRFRSEPVPGESMAKLVQAAMSAPSAGNEQPWHFVVVTERERLDQVPRVHPYAHMLHEAPAALLICGDEKLEKHTGYWVQDCSAATQNVLLAAHALGLGAVWLGIYPLHDRMEGVRRICEIPAGITPFSLVALGVPLEPFSYEEKIFDASRIHHETWGNRTGGGR